MKRFSANMRFICPKCGCDSTGGYEFKFVIFSRNNPPYKSAERIKVTCKSCGYDELFLCKDSEEKES